MKTRPILFSGPMVRAILDGRKTQTRRVVKPDLFPHCEASLKANGHVALRMLGFDFPMPYGQPGELLWVKETFGIHRDCPKRDKPVGKGWLHYSADDSGCPRTLVGKLKPSIFMRREYSRITLEIESVRVERLQDISESDAVAEGIKASECVNPEVTPQGGHRIESPIWAYRKLWESINGPGSWDKNPWVWVIGFKRIATLSKP